MNPSSDGTSPARPALWRRWLESPAGALALAVILADLLALAAQLVPLAPLERTLFISSYGITDNRRLLMRYGAILAGVFLAPLIQVWMRRGRASGEEGASPAAALPAPGPGLGLPAALAVAALIAFLLVGPGVALRPINGHEMVHFGYLNEIAHGRLLNLETRITYGPLQGYSLFAFMKAVGFNLVGFRLYWNVLNALFLIVLTLAAARYVRNRLLLMVMVLYAMLHTTARFYLPDAAGVNGGFWGWADVARHGWVSLAILLLARPLDRAEAGWPRFLTGAIYMLGASFAQETGVAGLVALGGLLLVTGRADPRRFLFRDMPLALGGAILVWSATILPVALRGGLMAFMKASAEVPGLFFKGGGNLPYPNILGVDRHGVPALAPYFLFPGFSIVALLVEWRRFLRGSGSLLLPLAIYASLSFVSALIRGDAPHLLNVSLAPIVLGTMYLDVLLSHRRRPARWLLPALLLVPLLVFRPGLLQVAAGLYGRITHLNPAPPTDWQKIPGERGGIWTLAGHWFDSADWGAADDPAAAPMIQRLCAGHPTFVQGNKSSLYYFLSDTPAAVPYTDISSQCFTPRAYTRLSVALSLNRPHYVFVMADFVGSRPSPANHYRSLGRHHGFDVYQRDDLPVPPPDALE